MLSYANGQIAYVGRVAEFAVTAAKPSEFGEAGANWSNEGWYLPVFWTPLTPAAVSITLDQYAPPGAMDPVVFKNRQTH